MSSTQVFTGPTFSLLEHKAFRTLSTTVGDHPESILYIGQQEHPKEITKDRWKGHGHSASLSIRTFDDVVSECYERNQYKGRVTYIDRPLLFRLVELGVEEIDSPANPFYVGDRFPRAGLVDAAENLYTELEFAGLLSSEAMRERLLEEGLTDRAHHAAELAEGIETVRQEILADELPDTYRTERMHHVITMETPLDQLLPAVDAVVLGGFTQFDALERDFLERISNTWPTVAILPTQADSDTVSGIDQGAARALETYLELGFSREHYEPDSTPSVDARRRVTANLYRHPENAPSTDDIDPAALGLSYVESETVSDEIRLVARQIRSQLADGVDPSTIGVVPTSPSEYADQIRESFDVYELPYTIQTEVPLTETALGEVVESICTLASKPRSIDTVLALLTNPLVSVSDQGEPIDHQELTRVAARVETTGLDRVLEHVDETVAATIESIVQDAEALSTVELESLPGHVDALLERLGVLATLESDAVSSEFRARESSAQNRLDRVLETLVLSAPVADPDIGDPTERLERALAGVSIRGSGRPDDESVTVCGLGEAFLHEFDHVYMLGMTASHFPSDIEQLSFAQPIYEAHPDFEQKDAGKEARYQFGAIAVNESSLQLSAPQRSQNGDPYVEADVMTELRRLIDLDEITIDGDHAAAGSQEDVQRAIGKVWGSASDAQQEALIDEAADAGTFGPNQHTRIRNGVECSSARADATLSPYDGKLSPETVAQVHAATERKPYSPSRLETYAACGFKYYMRRVLGIKAPDPLTREPDPGVRGSYIHDTLEHYYLSLQSKSGEPVNPGGDFDERQDQLLEIALTRLDNAFADYPETAFHEQWLTSVLAGLGTPEENRYYGPKGETDAGKPVARGLFYRFLKHEFDEPAKTTGRPTWFEARVGQPYDAGTPISDDPAIIETQYGSVPVHGLIDRVDTVPGTSPLQAVVRDYKTGTSIPGESEALLGLNFQLPLYALMAEDALDGIETVGAAYYQVSPPTSVNSRSGQITSQEMATWQGSDEVETPLLRHSYPHFETHEAFRTFVEETTTKRLGELAAGIEEGRFQPTVLDPSDAGCRYCDYAHVCDVRSHQRQETIQHIDNDGISAYVPPMARDVDAEDVVGVE
ncbi:PD-(D/E)XK nuclease family protein [Halobellus ordinarius]|uniref:PD-(D/E)XK nuclease family protein n=1 Tax=Halobellus ordinarius TaxID=3075120 RepID=UPI002880ACEB|nr:PD-(D/E)XK nuclease family protein [Halobellus sp. ZY16]